MTIGSPFEFGAGRYQTDKSYSYGDDPHYFVDRQKLAFIVGLIAVGLPIVMLLGTFGETCFYYSLSHFYYARFLGTVFVGMLVFIGTFMIAYRGDNPNENLLATIAGWSAYGVAVFPTNDRGCDLAEYSGRALFQLSETAGEESFSVSFQLTAYSGTLHYISAAILFAFLAYYAFFVFTRKDKDPGLIDDAAVTPQKRRRNRIYLASGSVIVVSIAAMALNALVSFDGWDQNHLTFWFESLALWAFGLSWMVKGRFLGIKYAGAMIMDQRDLDMREAIKGRT